MTIQYKKNIDVRRKPNIEKEAKSKILIFGKMVKAPS